MKLMFMMIKIGVPAVMAVCLSCCSGHTAGGGNELKCRVMEEQQLIFLAQGKYYKEDELRYKHFEMDIVGMKWNIYTSTIYYKRLQVTFTATLSRPGSDTKKVLKGKFMQRYPYDCSEIHHE